MRRLPPSSTLFPYTTLFRSVGVLSLAVLGFGVAFLLKGLRYIFLKPTLAQLKWSDWFGVAPRTVGVIFAIRSEEHTSELQSRLHLVCRLLLEKKTYCERPLA